MSLFYRPAWNLSSSCLSLPSMLLKAYPPSLATGQTHLGLYQLFQQPYGHGFGFVVVFFITGFSLCLSWNSLCGAADIELRDSPHTHTSVS